jgi:two-component system OmpR family response regulator
MTVKTDDQSGHSVARVLIIADDLGWEKVLTSHLNRYGFFVRSAAGRDEAQYILSKEDFDIAMLRLERSVTEQILQSGTLLRAACFPHIIVMAMDDERASASRFLDHGADDYFHISYTSPEIISRLHAIRRRRLLAAEESERSYFRKSNQPSLRFSFRGWVLDCARSELYDPDGIQVPLTKGEFCVLSKIVPNQGRVQTRQALTYALKGGDLGGYHRTTDTAISRLRRKLAEYDSEELIQAVPKEGYKLAVTAIHISDE